MIPAEPASVSSDQSRPLPDQLRLAVTAYLARFKGSSRDLSWLKLVRKSAGVVDGVEGLA
jgi:hypothetical protein